MPGLTVCVGLDQYCGRGQPERGKDQAAEDIRGVVLAPGRLEIGSGLGFQSVGDGVCRRLAGCVPGQLEGECRDPEPGDADGPRTDYVGQVVHAEQDPADPDQGDERDDGGDEDAAPPAAGHGQEDQEYRPVTDNRAE
jgi:hypothetical protein